MTETQGPQLPDNPSYPEQNQTEAQVLVHQGPGNVLVSLLNELGIIGSGVLGSLYAISQKDKADMESTIESMNTMLHEKETATALVEKNFERKLLNEQEEHEKQIRKLKEDEVFLSNQLALAKGTVGALGQELQNEKRVVEELKLQIGLLNSGVAQASENKKMLEAKLKEKTDAIDVLQDRVSLLSLEIKDKEKNFDKLNFSLAEKESECKKLNFIVDQNRAHLEEANSVIENLKVELLKTREELGSKKSCIDGLNIKMNSLLAERDDINRKYHILQEDYNDLKSNFAKKAASNSELLSKKDHELSQLEEKLGLTLTESRSNQALIANLTKERDITRAMLESEANDVKILRDEVQTAQETLRHSKLDASNLSKQLQESKRLTQELMSEFSRVQAESSEAQKLLNGTLDEAKYTSKLLSDELCSVKEDLKRTKEELSVASDELKSAVEVYESLKKELLEIYKKAENVGHELKEERKVAATLNRELEASAKVMQKHLEARITLEKDLDEATKSLDEMNKRALSLSSELENASSRTASLEAEKEMLYESLIEQKNVTREARENIEDAQNVITRLGSERGNLEKRAKKLEGDLAAAKGEILRLRRHITLAKGSANEHHKKTDEVEADTSVATKKAGGRRRRAGSTSQPSQRET